MKFNTDELSIYQVETVYQDLLEEFEKGDILLDMSEVNKVDMSIIQLFISTKKSCLESSKKFKIAGTNSEIVKIIHESGCQYLLGDSDE